MLVKNNIIEYGSIRHQKDPRLTTISTLVYKVYYSTRLLTDTQEINKNKFKETEHLESRPSKNVTRFRHGHP